jgi:hypothetical protein
MTSECTAIVRVIAMPGKRGCVPKADVEKPETE